MPSDTASARPSTSSSRPSEGSPARLTGSVRAVASLTPAERARMRTLMEETYAGVTAGGFEEDLDGKEWAILLTDPDAGRVDGFSTLGREARIVDGQRLVVLFSGDTVVARGKWGSRELPRTWGRLAFELAARERGARVLWLLISAGHRTYRFLPLFFRSFVPSATGVPDPELTRLLPLLATARFGDRYDPATGIVRLERPTPLRPGVAEPTASDEADPDVAFFLRANPGWRRGEELACLTELAPSNLTPIGRRFAGFPSAAGS